MPKLAAFFRESNPLANSQIEFDPKFILQKSELLGHRRLADSHFVGGLGDVEVFGYGAEDSKLMKGHFSLRPSRKQMEGTKNI